MDIPFYLCLMKAAGAHRRASRPHLAAAGYSEGQPKMLHYLRRRGACKQRELVEDCGIKPATVSRLMEGMEAAGLIRRTASASDKRAVTVELTPKGAEAEEETDRISLAVSEKALRGFSAEERQAFENYLLRAYENLTGSPMT